MSRKRPLWFRPSLLLTAVGALVGASFLAMGSAAANDESTVVAVVGDIQCGSESAGHDHTGDATSKRCQSEKVRALIDAHHADLIMMPGDLQYDSGSSADFAGEFGPTWGDLTSILRPAPGNHEYRDNVVGYRGFFGDYVTTDGQLFYGFGAGDWQGLSLDSNCKEIDCSASGAQYAWASGQLAAMKAADPTGCTIAEYHHPVVTSYATDEDPQKRFADTFALLSNQGVDIVVAGHVHAYERFAPVDGQLQPSDTGTVQFTVGTGGKSLYRPTGTPDERAAVFDNASFGALFLKLSKTSYTYQFIDVDGTVLDSGKGTCH